MALPRSLLIILVLAPTLSSAAPLIRSQVAAGKVSQAPRASKPALLGSISQAAHVEPAKTSRWHLPLFSLSPKAAIDPLGDRASDKVATFAGSWKFITAFSAGMAGWIAYNGLSAHGFDPAPYVGLNLVLSTVAALQAPFILMSQNRQAAKDRIRFELDLAANLHTEEKVVELHGKIDALSEDVRRLTQALAERESAAPSSLRRRENSRQ